MSYAELIQRALKGRSVNSTAKAWGINQKTLDRYVKGQLIPTFSAALIMAKEAEMDAKEVMEMLATEEQNRKKHTDILSKSFNSLLRAANIFTYRKVEMA